MRLNLKTRSLLVVGLTALLAAAIIFGVILPTVRYITKLNNETHELRVYLEKKYENTRRLRSSIQRIDDIKTAIDQYSSRLFFKGDELRLITALEEIAGQHHIEQKISSSNLDGTAGQQVSLSLNISGRQDDVWNYLTELEQTKFFLHIRQLQLTPAGGAKNKDFSSASSHLELNIYVNQ